MEISALPPELTYSLPLLATVVTLAVPPDSTIRLLPDPTYTPLLVTPLLTVAEVIFGFPAGAGAGAWYCAAGRWVDRYASKSNADSAVLRPATRFDRHAFR